MVSKLCWGLNMLQSQQSIVKKKSIQKKAPDNTSHEVFLLSELKRLKTENQRLQGTLDYLIQENKDLLEKRQRCLEALSLLIQ